MDVIVVDNNRKRKFEIELLGPFPKHVRCVEGVEYNISPNSGNQFNVVDTKLIAIECESDPESAKDSNSSIHADADSDMFEHDQVKINTSESDQTASTSNWNASSSGIDLYSLESRESVSVGEEREFSFHDDCCSSECVNDDVEYCTDKEFESLVGPSGVDSGDYVLSSGRWSVNQDTEQNAEKLTIDKEFEQYFSTLML